jgi:hypothetical protein
VPHTRVYLAAVPPLLATIVRDSIARHAEVEVVGEGEVGGLAPRAADVVVTVATGGELHDPYLRLMYRDAGLKVLTLSLDGRVAALWRMVPDRRELAEVSPASLAEAIVAARREV